MHNENVLMFAIEKSTLKELRHFSRALTFQNSISTISVLLMLGVAGYLLYKSEVF